MKILITSIGRRVELIQAFRSAAEKINLKLSIVGADVDYSAPALFFCDEALIVPRIKEDSYIPFLIEYCRKNNVDALIPTIDTDLIKLAKSKDSFGRTRVIISDIEKVSICRDKIRTAGYFHSLGLRSPDTIEDVGKYCGGYPAFIKPRYGSSSINAYRVESEEELMLYSQIVPEYIVQPFIKGTEYTVDVFCDFNGKPLLITPRIRLAVRTGEVIKTAISQDKRIIEEVKQLVQDFKPCGQISVQLIRENDSEIDYFTEINPRFGGGAPLSMKAGADSSEMILRLLSGEELSYIEAAAEDGAVFSRFDQSVRIK